MSFRNTTLIAASLIVALAVTAGCADREVSSHEAMPVATQAMAEDSAPHAPGMMGGGGDAATPMDQSRDQPPTQNQAGQRRMIIKTASLDVRAESPAKIAEQIAELARKSGGFVVDRNMQGIGDGVARVDVTLRVPAAQFEPMLAQMRGLGEPLRESVTGRDVTEEFVDVSARLKAKRALEARFLAILETSTSVEDSLKVEQELGRVRTEIEQIEGRKNYLADQTSLSTIQVAIMPPVAPSVVDSSTFMGRMGEAFDRAGDVFVSVVEGLIVIIGALLPIGMLLAMFGAVVYGLIAVVRMRRRKSA